MSQTNRNILKSALGALAMTVATLSGAYAQPESLALPGAQGAAPAAQPALAQLETRAASCIATATGDPGWDVDVNDDAGVSATFNRGSRFVTMTFAGNPGSSVLEEGYYLQPNRLAMPQQKDEFDTEDFDYNPAQKRLAGQIAKCMRQAGLFAPDLPYGDQMQSRLAVPQMLRQDPLAATESAIAVCMDKQNPTLDKIFGQPGQPAAKNDWTGWTISAVDGVMADVQNRTHTAFMEIFIAALDSDSLFTIGAIGQNGREIPERYNFGQDQPDSKLAASLLSACAAPTRYFQNGDPAPWLVDPGPPAPSADAKPSAAAARSVNAAAAP